MEPRKSKSKLPQLAALTSGIPPSCSPQMAQAAAGRPAAPLRPSADRQAQGSWARSRRASAGTQASGGLAPPGTCEPVRLAGLCASARGALAGAASVCNPSQKSTTRVRGAGQGLLLPFLLVRRQRQEVGCLQLDSAATHTQSTSRYRPYHPCDFGQPHHLGQPQIVRF